MQDANVLALVGIVDDGGRNARVTRTGNPGDYVYFVPWIEQHFQMEYRTFIERIVTVCEGYHVRTLVSETNGVGSFPHEHLGHELDRSIRAGSLPLWRDHYATQLRGVWTDNRRKQAMYGRMKGMLQAGQLVLPRNPDLLQQLASLEVTTTAAGNLRIEVPESRGHDDLADALGQALSAIGDSTRQEGQEYPADYGDADYVKLGNGLLFPKQPRLLDPGMNRALLLGPLGEETGLPW